MTSKRGLRRKSCSGKVRHKDQAGALVAVRRTAAKTGVLEEYHCKHCGGWHVGHKPGTGSVGSGMLALYNASRKRRT